MTMPKSSIAKILINMSLLKITFIMNFVIFNSSIFVPSFRPSPKFADLDYIVTDGRMIIDEIERIWKEAIVA